MELYPNKLKSWRLAAPVSALFDFSASLIFLNMSCFDKSNIAALALPLANSSTCLGIKNKLIAFVLFCCLCLIEIDASESNWQMGPFRRISIEGPILQPYADSLFNCPVQNRQISWEKEHVFNPAAIVRDSQVYLLYRAEDNYGNGIGNHTSRLGIAKSEDGIHFERLGFPILFPNHDEQEEHEFPGGCEDPRIVEKEDGTYVMTYTQWNHNIAALAVATSADLFHWQKHGYAFAGSKNFGRQWSKSGSIVCKKEEDRLIAAKIHGQYWMYFGDLYIHVATSSDLIHWEPLLNQSGKPLVIASPRPQKFDSALVEPGPPAILTKKGIYLLYNGKNDARTGDPKIFPNAYSAGQILLDANDPTKVLLRSSECFLTPRKSYELFGQYKGGTVFIEGLVYFKNRWHLYYGAADSAIGVAISNRKNFGEM